MAKLGKDRNPAPLRGLGDVGAAAWRERIELIEEEHARAGRASARKQLPHRPLALAHILIQQFRALQVMGGDLCLQHHVTLHPASLTCEHNYLTTEIMLYLPNMVQHTAPKHTAIT